MSFLFKILQFLITQNRSVINQTTLNFNSVIYETYLLNIKNLIQNIQNGLTLTEIETIIFLIIFIRFIILFIRYNLKTSFYITCIGLFSGYLWYRHLLELIENYSIILIKIPYLTDLGIKGIELLKSSVMNDQLVDISNIGNQVTWYQPFQLFYYAFKRGITSVDDQSLLTYYIDPISMYISNLPKLEKLGILPYYYRIYNLIIPQIFGVTIKLLNQASNLVTYTLITRIGKKFCPYFIRWHWTFIFIVGFVEQVLVSFIYRMYFFETYTLLPQYGENDSVQFQFFANNLNNLMFGLIGIHLGFIILALLHSVIGQYFYFPLVTENTELHVGKRMKSSVYSGGLTPWQDERQNEKRKNTRKIFPKIWYGWFGHQTNFSFNILILIRKLFKQLKKIIKNF